MDSQSPRDKSTESPHSGGRSARDQQDASPSFEDQLAALAADEASEATNEEQQEVGFEFGDGTAPAGLVPAMPLSAADFVPASPQDPHAGPGATGAGAFPADPGLSPEADQVPASDVVLARPIAGQPMGREPGQLASSEDQRESTEELVGNSARRRFLLAAVPSWLISLLVHLGLILILAAITLDPVQQTISLLEASFGKAPPAVEEFDLQGPTLESSSDSLADPLAMPAPVVDEVVAVPEIQAPALAAMQPDLSALEMNQVTESIMPSALLNTSALAQMTTALNSRSSASKSEMLERYGGNAASEKAVALALKWLAAHQARDGGWNFDHSAVCGNQCRDAGDMDLARNGATAMALLPFLGAGQTHLEGQYKETVYRGLAFLINRLKVTPSATLPHGSWHEPGGRMYSHGLAAITVCEAYAMTGDPDLLQPAQLSLNYLVYAQSQQDGGWRYEPGQRGDTSVVGWCLMALKSGKMGSLVVPPRAFAGADGFLNYVSTNDGALYGYDKPTANLGRIRATTAVGLLCRMYLGYPQEHPGIQEGVKFLSETGPKMDDLYYSYYATQVLRHNGGDAWEKWNQVMRDQLVKAQVTEGHAAGSWFMGGKWTNHGGRLYTTSLATMILEVYYRHMPLYSSKSADDDFEI